MPELSLQEVSTIKNMMLSSSYKEISDLLNISIDLVGHCVKELTAGSEVITHQAKLDRKKLSREPVKVHKTKVIKPKPVDQKKIEHAKTKYIEKKQFEHRRRERDQIPTRKIDYSKLVRVMIDKKTSIYCMPGEEEKNRKAFLKRMDSKQSKTDA